MTEIEISARAIRGGIAMLEGGGCQVRSSITDQPCMLYEGHPCYSPTRFHKYVYWGKTTDPDSTEQK